MRHVVLSLLVLASPVLADERDNAIFGGSEEPKSASTPAPTPMKASAIADLFTVGGRLEHQIQANHTDQEEATKAPLVTTSTADLYFDGQPNEDLRTFVRLRFTERRPKLVEADPRTTDVNATEAWIKWDVDNTAFFTAGKQQLRWGSGRFWNPTDFLVTEVRDPLATFDRRLGVDLLKLHIPDEKRGFNYYAIVRVAGADRTDEIAGALRGEFAIAGQAELALTAVGAKSEPWRLGVDLSSALGPIDAQVEAAFSRNSRARFYKGEGDDLDPTTGRFPEEISRKDETITQVVGGLSYNLKYSDDDYVTIGAEYFHNGAGYDDPLLGFYSFLNGASRNLYIGERYAAAYLRIPQPGSFNDTNITFSGLTNRSDESILARADLGVTFLRAMTWEAFATRCFGDIGELCFALPESYQTYAALPTTPEPVRGRLAALPSKRITTTLGTGLSVKF